MEDAKAALYAIGEFLEFSGLDIPVFISGTLVDQSGRTLSGQTGEAFYASVRHARPMCVGTYSSSLLFDLLRPSYGPKGIMYVRVCIVVR
jgi:5-methyltetrahydrofolate--homocysteine methyltransferase